ncbi:putative mitochondrial f1f0 atp synthase subunit F [Elaphomyces granulatus]
MTLTSYRSDKMSFITRRALSTLIPPKVASPNAIGAAQDAARMNRVVNFYARLPRGAAPEPTPSGLLERYQARYFGNNSSPMPLVHVIGGLMLLGYGMNYYYHLRHHKNNPH